MRRRLTVVIGALCLAAGALAVFPGDGSASAPRPVPPDRASTSTRGVTATSINVVFPVVNLNSLASVLGFAGDYEYKEQAKAIKLFVGQINKSGGINGRKIKPTIAYFTPTNETNMRALCKTWTKGSPAAFAVLDGVGTWSGQNELCVTQEGHTPFIGQWTTVTNWTTEGSPYLWWTGPDDAAILQAVVNWGLGTGLIGTTKKVGVLVGDRASDQLALNDYLMPDLRRAGVKPLVVTIPANPTESASTDADAPLVVEKLKAAGVTSVIPLLPFNAFFPVLQVMTQQQYVPRLLLSDYENSIQSALGLIPVPYNKVLNGQEGVTTETLGGIDDTRPESQGGYDPGVRSCWTVWHKAYPQVPPGNLNFYIEEQGPVQGWCQEIRLFAAAAKKAGRNLNRRTFVEALSKISDFPGGFSPTLTFGPDKFSGPTEYRVVELHNNTPPTSLCDLPKGGIIQHVCWVVKQPWHQLPPT
jgi:ABC-type branched-subunit amino acid transport system substrate-binding protein